MKKAFFFTFDALLAALLSMSVFAMCMLALAAGGSQAREGAGLALLAGDSLSALEKTGALAEAAGSSSSAPIEAGLAAFPAGACFTVSISPAGGATSLSAGGACACGGLRAVAKRSFASASAVFQEYVASMEVCTRK